MAKIFTSLTDPGLQGLLLEGAIGIIPTDTVYGLVARTKSPLALERFFRAKSRHNEPGTIIGASVAQFEQLGFSEVTLQSASAYWPNATSIVLDAIDVGPSIKQHRLTLPLRIPDYSELQQLLAATGPLMTTSANQPGLLTATTIEEAITHFGETVDFYVDVGTIKHSPSTILEITSDHTVIVHRRGANPIS